MHQMTDYTFFPDIVTNDFCNLQDQSAWQKLSKNIAQYGAASPEQLLTKLERSKLRERNGEARYLHEKWISIAQKKQQKTLVLDVSRSGPGGSISYQVLKTERLDHFQTLQCLVLIR